MVIFRVVYKNIGSQFTHHLLPSPCFQMSKLSTCDEDLLAGLKVLQGCCCHGLPKCFQKKESWLKFAPSLCDSTCFMTEIRQNLQKIWSSDPKFPSPPTWSAANCSSSDARIVTLTMCITLTHLLPSLVQSSHCSSEYRLGKWIGEPKSKKNTSQKVWVGFWILAVRKQTPHMCSKGPRWYRTWSPLPLGSFSC